MSKRRYELDWLRVIAVFMLIYFHSARVFDFGDFYVKNPSQSNVAEGFVAFLGIWAMPLLFFIAGASAFYALKRRSAGQFASERTKRLMIPFIFGMFFIAAPQIFMVFIQKAGNPTSFIAFWKFQFSVAPFTPIVAGKVGDASIVAATWEFTHLWFILYLFGFCLLALPLFQSIGSGHLRATRDKLAGFCLEHTWTIFLFALPLMLSNIAMFVMSQDFSRIFLIVPFVYGFIFYSDPRFGEAIDANYVRSFWIALVTTTALATVLLAGGFDPNAGGASALLWGPWVGLEAWLWIVAVVGLGRRRMNRRNAFLDWASEGSYPFYILHQLVVVLLAYWIVRLATGSVAKYLLLTTAALAGTVALLELIRRWAPTRYLFGMHARTKPATVPQGAAEPSADGAVALGAEAGDVDGAE